MNDSLGDRMKEYEKVYSHTLTPNSCLFIRVDGKAFHTFTRHSQKPFDQNIISSMTAAAVSTAREMQGFKLAYVQSDEATFVLTDFDTHQTQGWFGYKLNKIVSVTASLFTAHFNHVYGQNTTAVFDARTWVVPQHDVANVFIWRQQDWARNSVQMVAQNIFSQTQLQGKNIPTVLDMLYANQTPWEHYEDVEKYVTFILPDSSILNKKLDYRQLTELIIPKGDL